jgi:uncharacterized protein with beta-barrel porin domain
MTENGLAAWTTGYGSSQKRDGSSSQGTSGYTSTNFGDVIGVEKHFGKLVIGFSAAAGRTQATFGTIPGKVTVDSWHAGFYGSVPMGPVYLDSGFLAGTTDSSVRRTISAPGLATREGRTNISGMEWLWQGGVALPMYGDREYKLTPSGRLIVQGYSQDASRESNMDGLEVRVGKKSSLNVLSQMGLELSRKFVLVERPASWSLNLDWIHNYDPKGRLVNLSLSGNSAASYRYSGAKTGADAIRLGGAFDVALSERTTLRLSAEQQIQSQLSTTRGSISLGIAF